ncbi:hypothetical protein KM043_005605 [Ampulex compressa]|nr:hypothetical protein KM043_005605 [Ampulex compressa]
MADPTLRSRRLRKVIKKVLLVTSILSSVRRRIANRFNGFEKPERSTEESQVKVSECTTPGISTGSAIRLAVQGKRKKPPDILLMGIS